ncbi:DNA polymerase [Bacillus thuringiensis]|uniref:DNA polymerase n=1 Tax=Bacillus thuringiensis TaxID=1428 RepID=UPI000BFC9A4C|nr:DNA polymerase [Bacillus thuringiensis]PGT89858.1 hypothetical protein COD17_08905 [Bacillus thuringiensis]
MHFLRKGEKPKKKVSGLVELADGLTARYVATSSREHVMGYRNGEAIASLYVSASIIKELDVEMDKIQVAGEYGSFLSLLGVGLEEEDDVPAIEWDNTAKGSTNKVKGMAYEEYADTSQTQTAMKQGLEDFLYTIVPMQTMQEEHDLSWAERKNYRILIEDDEILEWIEGLDKTKEIVGFDTETSGLMVNRTKRDVLTGICMSYEDHAGVYFPLRQKRYENVRMGEERLLELLQPYCDKKSPKAKNLVTHNGLFDWKVMKTYGWSLNIVYDTMIRQTIKQISSAKNTMKLKGMAKRVLGLDVVELEDMYEKRTVRDVKMVREAVHSGASIDDITRFKLRIPMEKSKDLKDLMDFRYACREFSELYGCADADFPRLIHKEMDKEWDSKLDFTYRLEIALIPALGEQEFYGVYTNQEGIEDLYEGAKAEQTEVEQKIYETVGKEFKISSPQQKVKLLFEDMKIPTKPRYKTKSGGWSTDKDTLKDIAQYTDNDGNPRYPVIPLLQRYSKVSTLLSNFYSKLPKLIVDGFLFPSYNSNKAETGRLTCSNPNIQQTEPATRKFMIPESNEYYFLICDYSQVEYRLMAGLSGEMKVVNFFRENPEADYHILAYANMMGKAYADVTSAERKKGKVLNFGTSYGLEDEALALALYGDDTPFHQKMARESRKQYFDGVPDLRDYFERVRDQAEIDGYTETLFKRKRDIPEFQGFGRLSEFKRSSGRRKAGNMPVQGTAADIMKMAMYRVYTIFKKYGFYEDKARLVLNVHDEMCVQVHKSVHPFLATAIMREAMEIDFSSKGIPPLYIGANVGYCWKDGKVDELEAPVLLMDEKCAWAMDKFKRGEELPYIEDPRTYWMEEINKFALRVIDEEAKKDGITKLENANTIRILKYGGHFGDSSPAIIMEVLKRGHEKSYEDLSLILNWESPLAKKILAVCNKRIAEKGYTVQTVVTDAGLKKALAYFGKYAGNVAVWLVETGGNVDETLEKVRYAFANQKEVKKVDFQSVKAKKEGQEIAETFESIDDKVKKLLSYNKERNTFTLRMKTNDSGLLTALNQMLVPIQYKDNFLPTTKFTNFKVVYEDGTVFARNGELWIGNFLPLLKQMLVIHLTDRDYSGISNKIEEMGAKFVAVNPTVQSSQVAKKTDVLKYKNKERTYDTVQ